MKRKQIALVLGLAILAIIGGVLLLLSQTRFLASYKTLPVDRKVSCTVTTTFKPYESPMNGLCAEVIEVQRFFDRGSRIAEYDLRVFTDPTLSTPQPRNITRQNIFGTDKGRIDPNKQPAIEWRSDGLLIKKSADPAFLEHLKNDPRLKQSLPGQKSGEFFLPTAELRQ